MHSPTHSCILQKSKHYLFEEHNRCPATYRKFPLYSLHQVAVAWEKSAYEDTEDTKAGKTDSVKFAGILPISE